MNDSNPSTISNQAVEDLRALNPDDPGFLREIIDLFIQDVPQRIQEIEQALATKDPVTLSRAAHTIKGSCSNFGATKLAQISQAMEIQGKEGAYGEAATSLVALRDEFSIVAEALQKIT